MSAAIFRLAAGDPVRRPLHLTVLRALSTHQRLCKSEVPGINTLMVANRGEIACRVMRSAKKLGIETVAVYSDADADALHVRLADKKARLGPAPTAESYLRIDKILEAIDEHNVDAVHPGYGFLSENADFSDALEAKGIKFLGPKKHAITVMGDKKNSRIVAEEAGVNQIPGDNTIVQSPEHAVEIAHKFGYPVMIKAVHGGGGKGMRAAYSDAELKEAYHICKGEAIAFGNQDMMVRKYLDGAPRHIEIQVLADQHGNCVYLNERECSIQRRNQKVVEEAPSTFVTPELRKAMGEQSVALALACNYESAGTVEFLVDKDRNFYFLEMNTRLQVEHPITECITGVDLVEQMIRVAAGQPLTITQDDIKINGHAIETRVYAEDPVNFMPSIGQLTTYIEPTPSGEGEWVKRSQPKELWPDVRVDAGVVESSMISVYYDPMISKLITYGEDRDHAVRLMEDALDQYVIQGVKHNIPLLRDIMRQPRWLSGDTNTSFLEEVYPNKFHGYELNDEEDRKLVASAVYMHAVRTIRHLEPTLGHLPLSLAVAYGGKVFDVKLSVSSNSLLQVAINGADPVTVVSNWAPGDLIFHGLVDGVDTTVQTPGRDGHKQKLVFCGSDIEVSVRAAAHQKFFEYFPERTQEENTNTILTPMPGIMIATNVEVGDSVVAGQAVAVVEAMKMQNSLLAPRDGIVKAVNFVAGDKVGDGAVIVELE
eukprot:m.178294 g.178294  ORF g.178294 m.178294 type:complete len:711 (+) comp14517_c0_seq1:107-2239(+)